MGYIICLVYASKDLAHEYSERMKKRGNNSKFIEQMTNDEAWMQFYESNINDLYSKYKIELKEEQYLSNIKELFF